MCYYEKYDMPCGDWKWGHFKAHCTQEYRSGETCGMKLVWNTTYIQEDCKPCTKIATKKNKIHKECERIRRWQKEGNRRASIEQSEDSIRQMEEEIIDLHNQRISVRFQLRN